MKRLTKNIFALALSFILLCGTAVIPVQAWKTNSSYTGDHAALVNYAVDAITGTKMSANEQVLMAYCAELADDAVYKKDNSSMHGRANYVLFQKYLWELAIDVLQNGPGTAATKTEVQTYLNTYLSNYTSKQGNLSINEKDRLDVINARLVTLLSEKVKFTGASDTFELSKRKRAIKVVGFLCHLIGDTFAHSTFVPSSTVYYSGTYNANLHFRQADFSDASKWNTFKTIISNYDVSFVGLSELADANGDGVSAAVFIKGTNTEADLQGYGQTLLKSLSETTKVKSVEDDTAFCVARWNASKSVILSVVKDFNNVLSLSDSGSSFASYAIYNKSYMRYYQTNNTGYTLRQFDSYYTVDEHTVTYNFSENGGGSTTKTSAKVTEGTSIDLSPTAAKSGWTFVGWNTNKDATTALSSLKMGGSNITLYAIFKRTLTGTFVDYNASTKQTRTAQITIYNKATSGAITPPAQSTFTGWNTRGWSTSTAASAAPATSFSINADTTYYGLYQKTLALSYNPNGGSTTPSSQQGTQYVNSYANTTYSNPSLTLANAITKSDAVFHKWAKDSVSGTQSDAGTSIAITANTTMFATWAHTVTYNYSENGGSSATLSSAIVADGSAINLTPTATKAGWVFIGWNTDKDATTALSSLNIGTADVPLYAIFSKTLTATFIDYNASAKNSRTASVTIYNKATSGTVSAPAQNAYTGWMLRGWSTATTANATPATSYVISTDTTFYGLYQKTLILSYDANGGNSLPPDQSGTQYVNSYANTTYNNPTLTLASAISKSGSSFAGWGMGSVDGTKYGANTSITISANTTMCATWTPITHTVTYNYSENGGTSATMSSATVAEGSAISLTPTAAKSGWVFVGWNTSKDATTALSSISNMGTADVTLYAVFSKTLTATFIDYSGSTRTTRSVSVTIYNKATSSTITAPTQNIYTGWNSCGWSTATTPNATPVTTYLISADTTFYGLYQRTLTLTYDANGGSTTPTTQTGSQYTNSYSITTYGNPTFNLSAAITRTGFAFSKWASGDVNGTQYNPSETITISASTVMYAVWMDNPITYILNVISGMGSGNFTQGTAIIITANAAPSGQRFKQWDISPTVTFTDGTSNTSATAKFKMPAGAVTATAVYEDIPVATYLVTVSGGTGGGDFAQGATVTITANAAPSGQRFKQWNISPLVTFTASTSATSVTAKFTMPVGAVTVTAIYEDIPATTYAVTVNSGTGGGNYAAGATVTIAASIAPTGQQFKQWNISPSVTFTGSTNATSVTAKFTMPAGAVTATATYEPIPATTYAVTVNSGTSGGNFAQGATVTITASGAPAGQRFKQWNISPAVTFTDGTSAASSTAKFTMPAQEVTATAVYENIPTQTSFTVTYNTDGGNPASIAPVTVTSGTSITLPAAPTKSKSIFKGWKTGSTTLAAGASYTVTGNVTFTAQWAKTIFSTKYEATFLNWILFFLCFGFIWMWF